MKNDCEQGMGVRTETMGSGKGVERIRKEKAEDREVKVMGNTVCSRNINFK